VVGYLCLCRQYILEGLERVGALKGSVSVVFGVFVESKARIKGRENILNIPNQHFKDEDTQRPPINGLVVASAENDLGGDIFRCAAHCPRSNLLENNYFSFK